MNELALAEFEARIDDDRRFAMDTITKFDKVAAPDIARLTVGHKFAMAGIYNLHLGRFKEGRDCFRLAAVYCLERFDMKTGGVSHVTERLETLELAILSGDSAVEARAAAEGVPPYYPADSHSILHKTYFDALRMLVRGDAEAARSTAGLLLAAPDQSKQGKAFPRPGRGGGGHPQPRSCCVTRRTGDYPEQAYQLYEGLPAPQLQIASLYKGRLPGHPRAARGHGSPGCRPLSQSSPFVQCNQPGGVAGRSSVPPKVLYFRRHFSCAAFGVNPGSKLAEAFRKLERRGVKCPFARVRQYACRSRVNPSDPVAFIFGTEQGKGSRQT